MYQLSTSSLYELAQARITDDALHQLDLAIQSTPLDDQLLHANPVMELKRGIRALLDQLESVDLHGLLGKQGMFARLTGADLEARYRFNASVQDALAAVKRLRRSLRHVASILMQCGLRDETRPALRMGFRQPSKPAPGYCKTILKRSRSFGRVLSVD